MLHLSTVEPGTLELLRKLQKLSVLQNALLVGGTALALQYGHRKSIDLDFFGKIDVDSQQLIDELKTVGALTILKDSANIHIYVIDGIKVDIVNYVYPWISSELCVDGIRMARPEDIAAMKITAIVGRGTKKDFIDMHFLMKHYSLDQIFSFYSAKYAESSVFMAMKSLAYFDDAESEPMPFMMTDVSWEQIKEGILANL